MGQSRALLGEPPTENGQSWSRTPSRITVQVVDREGRVGPRMKGVPGFGPMGLRLSVRDGSRLVVGLEQLQ